MAPPVLDTILKEKLRSLLARGELKEIVDAYDIYPEVQRLRIPKTGETALHVAVSDERDDFVKKMVSTAEAEVLEMGNGYGDTPLHLAAKFGHTFICKVVADRDPRLIGIENEFGENPLFSAVSRGRTQAFQYLHQLCKGKPECRQFGSSTRKNGDTILHSAISEKHFDLAYIIIQEYPDLVTKVNNEGFSALHLLATRSSVFPSGIHLSSVQKLVYYCIRVTKLEKQMKELFKSPDPQPTSKAHLKLRSLEHKFSLEPSLRIPDLEPQTELAEIGVQDEEAANEKVREVMPLRKHDLSVVHEENLQEDEHTTNQQHVDEVELNRFETFCLWGCFPIILLIGFFVLAYKLLRTPFKLVQYILGYEEYLRLKQLKKRCMWSAEVMNKLMPKGSEYAQSQMQDVESPIFIAAKHGILEMVSHILDVNPEAIHDVNADKENIIMFAVKHRKFRLYEELSSNYWKSKKAIFGHVDASGNSLLHIAANLQNGHKVWRVRGAALHMHMEIKWYKSIKKSMPPGFFTRYNKLRKTPKQIFKESHQDLKKEGSQWLISTSQSCSVVAALIATVAFATSATVPGGLKQDNGNPTLEHKPGFIISAVASLTALSSSMISVVMFLAILTSSFELKDFRRDLPNKLLLGLTCLLISIVSMFISFYAGHYFVLQQEFDDYSPTIAYPLVCLPLIVFIINKFPLEFEALRSTLLNQPRNWKTQA